MTNPTLGEVRQLREHVRAIRDDTPEGRTAEGSAILNAAIAAFDATAELEAVKAGYERNRAALLKRLPQIGFDELLPVDGAFYVYVSVARFTNDAHDFASRMLNEAGVAATPGPDFDHTRGHRYMRFSFAGTEEAIAEGIERLAHFLK